MLYLSYLVRALMLASFVLISTEAHAQDICVSTPEGREASMRVMREIQYAQQNGPVPYIRESVPQGVAPNGSFFDQPKTPWGTTIPHLFGQYGQRDTQTQTLPLEPLEEKRFSWWKFEHDELHANGVIDELHAKLPGTTCCYHVRSGECRTTKYMETPDASPTTKGRRFIMIDGKSCPVSDDTKTVGLNSLKRPGFIVACAGKTVKNTYSFAESCPKIYCVGTAGGY